MKNLVFKRLVVASDSLKSGNQFEFQPRFNLITANDNSFGKSTLAKLLFWTLGGDPEAFHAWIECNGVVIDLLAPLFRENLLYLKPDSALRLPRKMFQRPFTQMASSPFELIKEGDFFVATNRSLTNEMIQHFMSRPMNKDLVEVCKHWYKPSPKSMQPQLEMGSNDGTVTLMKLDKTELVGKW